ncbi:hypothetical protein B2G88_00010 [Natronolimnobius baerhuensis]|uniref:Uncharacterized protein n=1 Tax=Natronolimnobius baerhuensis TaxID=253108 RepID=A0A202EDP1_9EURY|nr:hypothetical protein B2G88_00010 [Natronolimnobius baerhuensis]
MESTETAGAVQLAGYLTLLVTPAALLATAIGASSAHSSATIGFGVAVVLVGSVSVVSERGRLFETERSARTGTQQDVGTVFAVVLGAVCTYLLSVAGGFGPVLASAVVGVGVGIAVPRMDSQVYCGSFVGMVSPAVIPSLEYLVVAGLIAGGVFVATDEVFGGVGGKLGTIALCGCASIVALTGLEYGAGGAPAWEFAALVVPVAVAGAVVTLLVSVHLGFGAVVGSGVVGVGASVVFPLASSEPAVGTMLAAVAFCASFVGMSSVTRLEMRHVALAGGLCGLVYLVTMPAFDGAGGKLGTVAFIACLAMIGATELETHIRTRLARD